MNLMNALAGLSYGVCANFLYYRYPFLYFQIYGLVTQRYLI